MWRPVRHGLKCVEGRRQLFRVEPGTQTGIRLPRVHLPIRLPTFIDMDTFKLLSRTFDNGHRTKAQCNSMAADYMERHGPKIDIHCSYCLTIHTVPRTPEIPNNADHLGCNWCPSCMDKQNSYYHEWVVKKPTIGIRDQCKQLERRFPGQLNLFDHATT